MFKRFINRFLLASALFTTIIVGLLLHTSSSWSDTGKIIGIEVLGAQRIDPETVISYSNLKVGDQSDPDKLDTALKVLFKTGLFADVDFVTVGQYMQPSKNHLPVIKYYTIEEFKKIENIAYNMGFLLVSSSPLTRSSYHADGDFHKLKIAREALLNV